MPCPEGWCIIDEMDRSTVRHFNTQEEALAYAQKCAQIGEGEVLVHKTPRSRDEISTVQLPQEHAISPGDLKC